MSEATTPSLFLAKSRQAALSALLDNGEKLLPTLEQELEKHIARALRDGHSGLNLTLGIEVRFRDDSRLVQAAPNRDTEELRRYVGCLLKAHVADILPRFGDGVEVEFADYPYGRVVLLITKTFDKRLAEFGRFVCIKQEALDYSQN